jgi:hypothetical protein
MATGRLPKSSWVRYDKIFTLSENIVVRYYGTLSSNVFQEVAVPGKPNLRASADLKGFNDLC